MEEQPAQKMRAGTALFILEIFMFSVNVSIRLSRWLNCDRRSMLITVMLVVALIAVSSFSTYVFRVFASVLFSLFWALLAFEFTLFLPHGSTNRWFASVCAFFISLVFHKTSLLKATTGKANL